MGSGGQYFCLAACLDLDFFAECRMDEICTLCRLSWLAVFIEQNGRNEGGRRDLAARVSGDGGARRAPPLAPFLLGLMFLHGGGGKMGLQSERYDGIVL